MIEIEKNNLKEQSIAKLKELVDKFSSPHQETSKDPLGHVKLSVKDLEKSKEFYELLFTALGFQRIADHEKSAAWATQEGFGMWITQAEHSEPAYTFASPGLHHLCFKARSK